MFLHAFLSPDSTPYFFSIPLPLYLGFRSKLFITSPTRVRPRQGRNRKTPGDASGPLFAGACLISGPRKDTFDAFSNGVFAVTI